MKSFFDDETQDETAQQPKLTADQVWQQKHRAQFVDSQQRVGAGRPFLDWKWLVGIGCLAVTLFVALVVAVSAWFYLSSLPSPAPAVRYENTADQYLQTFTSGNHALWQDVLTRFDANEFRDWQDMNDYAQPKLDDILKKAEAPAIAAHEQINGKLWVAQTPDQDEEVSKNRREARRVIQSFVDGYEKWLQ